VGEETWSPKEKKMARKEGRAKSHHGEKTNLGKNSATTFHAGGNSTDWAAKLWSRDYEGNLYERKKKKGLKHEER